jgi:acetoin utilization deacetylase AcuC-like enzyme
VWCTALARIRQCAPGALVVPLGVDTFENDPISFFELKTDDFTRYGRLIGALGIPMLFILEGGYAVAEIDVNAVNVLRGFG